MPNQIEIVTLVPTITVAANGNSLEYQLDISKYSKTTLYVITSAVAGTLPTIDITIRDLEEIGGYGFTNTALAQISNTGFARYAITPTARKLYATWTLGGSAGNTVTIKIVIYGTIS